MLEAADLQVKYKDTPALSGSLSSAGEGDRIHCRVQRGGESTLLKAISGIMKVSAGWIRFGGERIDRLASEESWLGGSSGFPKEERSFPR